MVMLKSGPVVPKRVQKAWKRFRKQAKHKLKVFGCCCKGGVCALWKGGKVDGNQESDRKPAVV